MSLLVLFFEFVSQRFIKTCSLFLVGSLDPEEFHRKS